MTIQQPTRRERLLLNVLPAAVVLALYAFSLALPAQREYQAAGGQLKNMRVSAVNESVAEQSRRNLVLSESSLKRLNDQTRQDREQIAWFGQRWQSGDERLSTVQEVTELLQQFELSIVSQEFEKQPQLSSYLKGLEEIVVRHSGETAELEYWQIELAGEYQSMLNFLHAIRSDELRAFPVTLTMKASESGNGVHTWSIVLVV